MHFTTISRFGNKMVSSDKIMKKDKQMIKIKQLRSDNEESSLSETVSNKENVKKRSCFRTLKQVVPEENEETSLYLVSRPLGRIRLEKPFNSKGKRKQGSYNLAVKTNEHQFYRNNSIREYAQPLQIS